MINKYFQAGFTVGNAAEQRLIESIISESIQIAGHECYYIPRTSVKQDRIFGEDVLSQFTRSFAVEMYLENVMGWEGDGELFKSWGLQITDQATFIVSKRRWEEEVSRKTNQLQLKDRPAEGDLIFFPKTNALFDIKFVQHLDPFYQLGKFYVYSMQCELFNYSSEIIDTGIKFLDDRADFLSMDLFKSVLENSSGGNLLNSNGEPIALASLDSSLQTPLNNSDDIATEGEPLLDFTSVNPFGEL